MSRQQGSENEQEHDDRLRREIQATTMITLQQQFSNNMSEVKEMIKTNTDMMKQLLERLTPSTQPYPFVADTVKFVSRSNNTLINALSTTSSSPSDDIIDEPIQLP